MRRLDKYQLNDMLNRIPYGYDVQVTITKLMGDTLTFYNYEKCNLQLFDEYLLFHESEDKTYKVRYENITQIRWQPVFKDRIHGLTVDGEIVGKKDEMENGE